MPLSVDLRSKVIIAVETGKRITDVAKDFNINRGTIYNWIKLKASTNSLEYKKNYRKGHHPKIENIDEFKEFVKNNKTDTAKNMIEKWHKKTGHKISKGIMSKYLKRIGYTVKKNVWVQRS